MRCVLHIGTEKTGTTTLQDFLYANQQALREQGVGLSNHIGKNNNRQLCAYFQQKPDHFFIDNKIRTPADRARFFAGFIEKFTNEVHAAAKECTDFIITSEHFHSQLRTVGEIRALKALLDSLFSSVTVVCYFREQSEVGRSAYSTAVRGGVGKTGEEFLRKFSAEHPDYNYHDTFTKWAQVFDKNNLLPIIFDRKNFHQGDIRQDLIARTLPHVDLKKLDYSLGARNEQLKLVQLKLCQSINQRLPRYAKDGNTNKLRRKIVNYIESRDSLAIGKFENPVASKIHADFNASNIEFARQFLGTEGNPFPAPQPAAISTSINHLVDADTLLGVFAEFFSDLCAELLDGKVMTAQDADQLQAIAQSHEQQRPLTKVEARTLMRLAFLAKPQREELRESFQRLGGTLHEK